MMKSPKSLKELSCIVAARAGALTDDILAQPDYRELCHRVLHMHTQRKLLNEYRDYNPDGSLKKRYTYDENDNATACWLFDGCDRATYMSNSGFGTTLLIRFYRGEIRCIQFKRPFEDIFELFIEAGGLCSQLSITIPFGNFIHRRTCLKLLSNSREFDLDLYKRHAKSGCNCEASLDIYAVFDKFGYATSELANDLELD
jgi:hypothetical protein